MLPLAPTARIVVLPFAPFPHLTPTPQRPHPRRSTRSARLGAQLCLFRDWLDLIKPEPARVPRSDLMCELLRILRRAAMSSSPVPTNPQLAGATGAARQSTARAVRAMERENFYKVEIRQQSRRIRFPDGMVTDWGHFREGHAPGPRRVAPALVSKPAPALARVALPCPPLPREPAQKIRAADSCQFATWPDHLPPPADPDSKMCGARALRGKSWCAEHYVIVFGKNRRAGLLETTSLCCSAPGGAP